MQRSAKFLDRAHAGTRLGEALRPHVANESVVVLGVPPSGLPIAARVAEVLNTPLDVLVVRTVAELGPARRPIGAVASGDASWFDSETIEALRVPPAMVERAALAARVEVTQQEWIYGGGPRLPVLEGETAIVIDQFASTGRSLSAAVSVLRAMRPRAIIVGVPVASREAVRRLRGVADVCIVLATADARPRADEWYATSAEPTIADVRALLTAAQRRWDAESSSSESSRLVDVCFDDRVVREQRSPSREQFAHPRIPVDANLVGEIGGL